MAAGLYFLARRAEYPFDGILYAAIGALLLAGALTRRDLGTTFRSAPRSRAERNGGNSNTTAVAFPCEIANVAAG